jgi:hypothetical protein
MSCTLSNELSTRDYEQFSPPWAPHTSTSAEHTHPSSLQMATLSLSVPEHHLSHDVIPFPFTSALVASSNWILPHIILFCFEAVVFHSSYNFPGK